MTLFDVGGPPEGFIDFARVAGGRREESRYGSASFSL
jgi:hypothetical protein